MNVRISDVACRLTRISWPCGCRFSGDETGVRARLCEQSDAVTGINRADSASVKLNSILRDPARDGNSCALHLAGPHSCPYDQAMRTRVPRGHEGSREVSPTAGVSAVLTHST